jgi:hypothetical protein
MLLRTARFRNTGCLHRKFVFIPSVTAYVGFECLSVAAMTGYRPVEVHGRFGGMHLLDFRVEE